MTKIEKAEKLIKDGKHLDKYKIETTKYSFKFTGKPENYSRERKGRGNHFYNPKSGRMLEYREAFQKQLDKDDKKYLKDLIANIDTEYMVSLDITYGIGIQKTESIERTALKLSGVIKPALRPDIDNYDKFILDVLHDVVYDDDKRVININSKKIYSVEEHTKIDVKIEKIIKD